MTKRIRSTRNLADVEVDKYWQLVRDTVETIFCGDPNKVQPLEQQIRRINPKEQILFYNTDPMSIASEVVNPRPNAAHIEQYNELRDKAYRIT